VNIPKGFKFAGLHCGIKRKRKDLGIIYSEKPCIATGVFTTNVVKAAPVVYNMKILEKNFENIKVIVVNSGIANACTGEQGMKNAMKMAEKAAKELGISVEDVLISSTGVIGAQLPIEKIEAGIEEAVRNLTEDPLPFAEAIMTTDTVTKTSSVKINISGKEVSVLGIAKGSGMIHPNMATMLSFILTDAQITPNALKKLLKASVDKTYNMIDVDGDTSTNDMVLMLANGLSNAPKIHEETEEFKKFFEAVDIVNTELAKKIVEDGEGATKLIEVKVINAPNVNVAKKIARSVVSSNLVKTAIYGEDANWGRIFAAAGYSGAIFDHSRLDLYIENEKNRIMVAKDGREYPFDEAEAKELLSSKHVKLILDMKQGNDEATAWGSDLTEKYVEINGRYRT